MLKKEAAWLQAELKRLPVLALDPLLSIGSGQEAVRTTTNPWISQRVFSPLEARGVKVIHHEHEPGPGVDIAGDLWDGGTLASLSAVGARSVLCCNVLEHVEPRGPITAALAGLVAPGGLLIVTVPHRFPYHPDPIDTMYRPSVADLELEFVGMRLLAGAEVACGTLWRYLLDVPDARASAVAAVQVALNRLSRRSGGSRTSLPTGSGAMRYLACQTSVACAVFERPTR